MLNTRGRGRKNHQNDLLKPSSRSPPPLLDLQAPLLPCRSTLQAALTRTRAYVTILDINEEQGNAVSHTLNAAGHHVQFTKTDMTSFSSQTAGFKSALSFAPSKSIDIVLASAGLSGTSIKTWVDNLPTSQPDAEPELPTTVVIDVNLMGVYYTAHLALFYFKQTATSGDAASKQLILISSLAGYVTLSNVADYNASKYGVRGFWRGAYVGFVPSKAYLESSSKYLVANVLCFPLVQLSDNLGRSWAPTHPPSALTS